MTCGITGCNTPARFVRRGVVVHLPGHPAPVTVGDLNLCPAHERSTKLGRASIRADVITAALARRA